MDGPSQQPLHQYGPPQPDYAVTYVTNEAQGDVHVFVPDGYHLDFVGEIAQNFSRTIQEPVIVYHDDVRRKFRLCPAPAPHPFGHDYGVHVLSCDMTMPPPQPARAPAPMPARAPAPMPAPMPAPVPAPEPNVPLLLGEPVEERELNEPRIPRPPNSWILYRQSKSRELSAEDSEYSGMTASELSTVIARMWHQAPAQEREFWQGRAREEERIHKQMYPDYKYTTKKSAAKNPK